MTDEEIERELAEKGLNGPRVTAELIEESIIAELYFSPADSIGAPNVKLLMTDDLDFSLFNASTNLMTFCVLVLRNGFTVAGISACASPENFDLEIGRKIARQDAINKIWPLMGYALKEQIYQGYLHVQA